MSQNFKDFNPVIDEKKHLGEQCNISMKRIFELEDAIFDYMTKQGGSANTLEILSYVSKICENIQEYTLMCFAVGYGYYNTPAYFLSRKRRENFKIDTNLN